MLFSYTLQVYSELWAQQVVGIGMMWFLLVSDKLLSQVILGLSFGFATKKVVTGTGWLN